MMTTEERELLAIVDSAASGHVGLPAYQKLVNSIADRVAQEFGLAEQDFDLADAALREADCGPDGEAYFVLYEKLLREKHEGVPATVRRHLREGWIDALNATQFPKNAGDIK